MNHSYKTIVISIIVTLAIVLAVWSYSFIDKSPGIDIIPGESMVEETEVVEEVEIGADGVYDTKIINCNPSSYTYFRSNKPCLSDMTEVDFAREEKAIAILLESDYLESEHEVMSSVMSLHVSSKQYSMLFFSRGPTFGFAIIDLFDKRVVDKFNLTNEGIIEMSQRSIVYVGQSRDQDGRTQDIRKYVFGEGQVKVASGSEIAEPYTYYGGFGEMSFSPPFITASSSESFTLEVYNDNDKSISYPDHPSWGFNFKEVGEKKISF